jgi:hypothetical protein
MKMKNLRPAYPPVGMELLALFMDREDDKEGLPPEDREIQADLRRWAQQWREMERTIYELKEKTVVRDGNKGSE